MTGRTDFLVHVAVRDADHQRSLDMDAFTSRPEVFHIETSLIFEHVRSDGLPLYDGSAAALTAE